jgi:hypothetical protein
MVAVEENDQDQANLI